MNPRLAVAALFVLPLIGLVGCSGAASERASSAPPFLGGEAAQQAAEQTFRGYVESTSGIDYADPATFTPVYAWVGGKYLAANRQMLDERHDAGEAGAPATILIERFNRVVADPTRTPPGGTEIGVCYDRSSVSVSDGHGTATHIPRHEMQSVIVTLTPASDTATHLKIVSVIDGDLADCAGLE